MTHPPVIAPQLAHLVAQNRRRVLLVDDDQDALEMLGFLLEKLGQEVLIVSDSSQALAAAEKFQPQIAILDLEMPKVSGFDLAKAIRLNPALRGIGLFALSGWNDASIMQRCKEFGFDRFFCKPTPEDQILFALSDYPPARA